MILAKFYQKFLQKAKFWSVKPKELCFFTNRLLYICVLTLKWSRPSVLPLVVKGGSLWTLTQKSTFPNEFGGEMRATDKVIQKNQNTGKKLKIGYAITKWRPKNQFLSRDIKFLTKNGKTTFLKEFCLEIWLIIEDCKYYYTAEIKFGKSYSVALLWGKQILNSALKMLIYAN